MGRDGYAGLAILAASLALFAATLGLERHPMVPVGPGFYPRIVLGMTAAFAVLLILADWRSRQRKVAAAPSAARSNYALVLVAFAIFAAYVIALPYVGFRVATVAFLLTLPVAFERPPDRRRWVVLVVVALAATAISYFVFERYLHVLLPRGLWTGF